MVSGLSADDGASPCRTVRHPPDDRRGRRGRRAAARGHDAPGRGRRPVPRAELRARQPVDELRTAGLPSAARRLDGDLPRHRGRPRVGARWLAPYENEAPSNPEMARGSPPLLNDPAAAEIYPLSLHDALPISGFEGASF